MIKNIFKTILILILIFVFGLLIIFAYNYFQSKSNDQLVLEENELAETNDIEVKSEAKEKQLMEDSRRIYNEHFPDFITGILIIISETEAKIKTQEGNEFLVDPSRPIAYYLESGLENGSKAILQGKIIDEKTVFLGNIKPLIEE
jgi:hypothetical protein